jgi:predicted metalloenzyme YecM
VNAYLDLVHKFGAHNSNFIASLIGSELGNFLLFLTILIVLRKNQRFGSKKMSQQLLNAELMPSQMKTKLDGFMHKIQSLSEILHINLQPFQADHIAMRINDAELAKQADLEWRKEAKVISNAQINGRPIMVLLFDQPLQCAEWQIECLELPYPAEGKVYPEQSWEHVEFVIPSAAETAEAYLQDLKQQFPAFADNWGGLAQRGVKVKLSSPKGEGERLNNPTVAFKYEGVCIKLHPHSLKKIVESEQSA